MRTHGQIQKVLPPGPAGYLRDRSGQLRRGEIGLYRLIPLLTEVPISEAIRRREGLFHVCEARATPFGYEVDFSRRLRSSRDHPEGRLVQGSFDILAISDLLCILGSSLPPDVQRHGPALFARSAYPLARRPFINSDSVRRLVDGVAADRNWAATALDAMGYERQTRKFRRDMKPQPVDDAFDEMKDQKRQVHQVKVAFFDGDDNEAYRASFNRYGEVTVYQGCLDVAVQEFVFPAVNAITSEAQAYAVERERMPSHQEALQLSYADEPFGEHEDMKYLCEAVRGAEGLSVTTVHLNPYLQAQVLDFFTGAAVELVVMDASSVCLIPRSSGCRSALERIAETIFYYFGEAEITRGRVAPT